MLTNDWQRLIVLISITFFRKNMFTANPTNNVNHDVELGQRLRCLPYVVLTRNNIISITTKNPFCCSSTTRRWCGLISDEEDGPIFQSNDADVNIVV